MTFFPPGNRSKPGERNSYSPRHGIKGKREPGTGILVPYVRDYLSKFYFIARNSNIKRKDRFIHLHRKRAKPGSHGTLLLFKSKEDLYKLIPIFVTLLGGLVGLGMHYVEPSFLGVESIISALEIGLISGSASTGMHQMVKQIWKK